MFRKIIEFDPFLSFIESIGSTRYGIISKYDLPGPWPTVYNVIQTNKSCAEITAYHDPEFSVPVHVYPNPFQKSIHFDNPENIRISYELVDVMGNSLR